MSNIKKYLSASVRENTKRSYASAVEHFEVEWGGLLPCSSLAMAEYLSAYAGKLSIETLKARKSAISKWHKEQGFSDPADSQIVKDVLKGIREIHPHKPSQAMPIAIEQLDVACDYLNIKIDANDRGSTKAIRDKAILLVGFWRGFRPDELSSIKLECVDINPGHEIGFFLPRTKRSSIGDWYKAPALKRLCPVQAAQDWIDISSRSEGPMFVKVDRWGKIHSKGLHADSFSPIIKSIFSEVGILGATGYSLRRGFATWAGDTGWSIKALMDHVGWKDMKSASKYIDSNLSTVRKMIESSI